ncbi:MAG: response regulator transcription factor [Anaerolineae bacterium]|nr:response regulator transcription factor [Anaerolineae bacterium]
MDTILLVEDALELADVIDRELTAEGYRVVRAADGVTALRVHEKEHPDLVILDWMLPEMDGLEVLRHLRQDPSCAVAVLMLTARSEEIDRVVGLELGADDYLTKPFGMRELKARVGALLRRTQRIREVLATDRHPEDSPLTYGPLQLILSTFQARLGDEPLDLTRTEFALLHLLLRNPGRVFARDYLLETIWRGKYEVGDRSVDNTILRLRKKLGVLGDEIETVWSVGYRLRPL